MMEQKKYEWQLRLRKILKEKTSVKQKSAGV